MDWGLSGALFHGNVLPIRGNGLRHTYRTIGEELQISEVAMRLLMGHSLRGVNQKYLAQAVLAGSMSLRQAQAAISRRICTLLGL
jgi:hypothetical protein